MQNGHVVNSYKENSNGNSKNEKNNGSQSPTSENSRVERLENEFVEVARRLHRLRKALDTDGFAEKVGPEQYDLLRRQHDAMHQYRNIVALRTMLVKFKGAIEGE